MELSHQLIIITHAAFIAVSFFYGRAYKKHIVIFFTKHT